MSAPDPGKFVPSPFEDLSWTHTLLDELATYDRVWFFGSANSTFGVMAAQYMKMVEVPTEHEIRNYVCPSAEKLAIVLCKSHELLPERIQEALDWLYHDQVPFYELDLSSMLFNRAIEEWANQPLKWS